MYKLSVFSSNRGVCSEEQGKRQRKPCLFHLMATDSPKIPNYVPQVVYDQLMQFKAKRGLKSISMVVTAVLEEYFGLKKAPIGAATASRLETLEDRVASLTFTVAALSRAMLHLLLLPALSSIGLKYRDTTFDRD